MTAWDDVLAASPRNGLQLDIGHYVAGTGQSPVPLIEKLHARIFSMHLKDRKKLCHDRSENMPWGQGDTPIREVLQCLKNNKWAIPAGVEFEYNVPAGSTWDAELAKCVKYRKGCADHEIVHRGVTRAQRKTAIRSRCPELLCESGSMMAPPAEQRVIQRVLHVKFAASSVFPVPL